MMCFLLLLDSSFVNSSAILFRIRSVLVMIIVGILAMVIVRLFVTIFLRILFSSIVVSIVAALRFRGYTVAPFKTTRTAVGMFYAC